MEEIEELIREVESLKTRVQALEKIAEVAQPPREKVVQADHDSSQDQE